jgi:hypothetical protein
MFPHFKIHKYIWTSPDRKTQSNWLCLDRKKKTNILDVQSVWEADGDNDLLIMTYNLFYSHHAM